MNDEDFKEYLEVFCKFRHVRKLDDGTWAGIFQFIYTWAICTEINLTGYGRRYCYTSETDAVRELDKMHSSGDVPEGFERRLPEPYYFTIVGFDGIPHTIGQCMTEREIIDHANLVGHSHKPAVKIDGPSDEAVKKAVAMLNYEGRHMEIFRIGRDNAEFIKRARELDLEHEARQLARGVMMGGF